MANSASIRTGLASLMQDHLSSKLVSTLVNVMPFIMFLLGRDGNKQANVSNAAAGFGLGRPGVGSLLSGVPVSRARREEVLNSDKYMPIIQTTLPAESDGKVMTMTDTMPTRTNWATNTPSSYVTRPFFKWVERADPIFVPKKEIRRTKKAAGNEGPKASAAVGDLFRFESESVLSTHINWWNKQFWGAATVAPSSVDAAVWDSPYSIRAALGTSNVYGGVDRGIAANAWWKGNFDSTHRASVLEDLINQANYSYGCAKKGVGINLLMCGLDLFPVFKSEAKAKGGLVIYDGKIPGVGEFGFTKEVVKFNNTYVVMDPQCPSKTNGDSTNAVTALNLDTWTVAVSPDANFSADEPFDLSKTEGGKDAIKSQLRTELITACEAPSLNVWWDDVG